jgi:ArsR family transcriptional regulator, arsenate/arsenite/antimonite-responsive transcriptional repressor
MNRTQIQNISRALADATRLRIFEEICSNEQTSCSELVSMRDVTPATVSHHLKVLQDAGLIRTRREGLFVYSSTAPGVIEDYTNSLGRMLKRKSKSTARTHTHKKTRRAEKG